MHASKSNDNIEYWKEQGKTYYETFPHVYNSSFQLQEEIIKDYLGKIDFSTVLEIGCGFGRITKIILDIKPNHLTRYVAIDVSQDQLANAEKYLGDVMHIIFIPSDIQSFNTQIKFDLVIASEVLMHIPHDEIEGVIAKLVSLSNKHIVNIDWYDDEGLTLQNKLTSIHDYPAIYRKHEVVKEVARVPIKNDVLDVRQSLFHAML